MRKLSARLEGIPPRFQNPVEACLFDIAGRDEASEEEKITLLFLSQFKTAAVDQSIVDAAAALYRQWHPSHGLDVNDAILAATVMQTGGQIFCLNTKHYLMPDLLVNKAW